MKKIAFVILTYQSETYLEACLRSVCGLVGFQVQIYLVDNGSSDRTRSIIEQMEATLPVSVWMYRIYLDKNHGTTYSRNLALRQICNVDYICILDSDTVINNTAIKTLAVYLDEHAECGIVGPKMADSTGKLQMSARQCPTLADKILKAVPLDICQRWGEALEALPDSTTDTIYAGYLLSACWLLRPSLLQTCGFLDEHIFYAPEDAEYCIRVWKSGSTVVLHRGAHILHHWQRLSRKKRFSMLNYQHIRGLFYMFRKHHCFLKPFDIRPYVCCVMSAPSYGQYRQSEDKNVDKLEL